MLWFAYECCSDESYHVIADRKRDRLESLESKLRDFLGDSVITEASGTVEADDLDDAFEKIRVGKWEYSQRL